MTNEAVTTVKHHYQEEFINIEQAFARLKMLRVD